MCVHKIWFGTSITARFKSWIKNSLFEETNDNISKAIMANNDIRTPPLTCQQRVQDVPGATTGMPATIERQTAVCPMSDKSPRFVRSCT